MSGLAGHPAPLPVGTGAIVRCDRPVTLSSRLGAELLALQGRPIGEPVVPAGPFVMNTEDEIGTAVADFHRTGSGG